MLSHGAEAHFAIGHQHFSPKLRNVIKKKTKLHLCLQKVILSVV